MRAAYQSRARSIVRTRICASAGARLKQPNRLKTVAVTIDIDLTGQTSVLPSTDCEVAETACRDKHELLRIQPKERS